MFSPGHTLASITYVIGDAAFVHDTFFMPDGGTARADFPGGSAKALWASIQAILALPDDTRLFTGHDYQPGGREPRWESTVAQQKQANAHVVDLDEAAFVALREARDKTLSMPKLMLARAAGEHSRRTLARPRSRTAGAISRYRSTHWRARPGPRNRHDDAITTIDGPVRNSRAGRRRLWSVEEARQPQSDDDRPRSSQAGYAVGEVAHGPASSSRRSPSSSPCCAEGHLQVFVRRVVRLGNARSLDCRPD